MREYAHVSNSLRTEGTRVLFILFILIISANRSLADPKDLNRNIIVNIEVG
jgi:hypothetical protein